MSSEHNGVRLHMLHHSPGKTHRLQFLPRRRTLRLHFAFEVFQPQRARVRIHHHQPARSGPNHRITQRLKRLWQHLNQPQILLLLQVRPRIRIKVRRDDHIRENL